MEYNKLFQSCFDKDRAKERNAAIEGESLAIFHGITTNRMFLYGMPFIVVTDHKPLVNLYNNPKKQGPARVEHHRLKLQAYRFEVRYERGVNNPTDYKSRHPLPLTPKQRYRATKDAFYVNAIIDNDIPDAMTEEIVQDATNKRRAVITSERLYYSKRIYSRYGDGSGIIPINFR